MRRLAAVAATVGMLAVAGCSDLQGTEGKQWITGKGSITVVEPAERVAPVDATGEDLDGEDLSVADYRGKVVVLNVFASWCFACRDEHPILMQDGKRLGIKLVGFNYKDEPEDAKRWIAQYGDPYDVIVADLPGDVAIDFGVTGAPETFLVDANGIIRYKYISPITPEVIATELLPRISLLKQEAAK